MHKFSISKRYGQLFEVVITDVSHYSERIVFPQFRVPLVFRTDASARLIAKQINDHFNNENSEADLVSLSIDDAVVANLPQNIIEEVLSTWNAQAIYLGDITIKHPIYNSDVNNDAYGKLLRKIYRQAVTVR